MKPAKDTEIIDGTEQADIDRLLEHFGKNIKSIMNSVREQRRLLQKMKEDHTENWPVIESAYNRVLTYFVDKRFLPVGCPVQLVRTHRRDVVKAMGFQGFGVAGFAKTSLSVSGVYTYDLHVIDDWVNLDFAPSEVIAHEMVHIEQLSRGDLSMHGMSLSWKGMPQRDWFGTNYMKLPWEKEAFSRMTKISKDCADKNDRRIIERRIRRAGNMPSNRNI